ncbi:TetR/AcrR family transcriptional regulator [Actinophytocola algeriensis]|uniref:AcrR family transcriptional regulator n=1 Tax=Actinophytocola algeriensis TaxID=1768010 RepID=A0A7W7Q715_9PSEU|nr:TetR/AcrR family transcriptional regulator [Actinophytocola algeriensis]MBB4908154.1 AcrR family transcriptional regulator [Actinophytocola algeriensis]MBE1480184.1 AcrR family transcriptional regulator [Actinophytocola algeriensis]
MRADARRNYERIVATARDVFFEHGIEAPLDDVVKRAGVGAGTLYRHFPNREVLIEAVYRTEIEEIAEQAYALARDQSAEDAIREWFRELIRFHIDRSGLAAALKAAIDEGSETFQYCKQKLRDAAWALLEPAQAVGAVRSDLEAVDLMRLSHGIGTAAKYADEASRDRMLSVLMEGLKP